jgi:TolB-like protein
LEKDVKNIPGNMDDPLMPMRKSLPYIFLVTALAAALLLACSPGKAPPPVVVNISNAAPSGGGVEGDGAAGPGQDAVRQESVDTSGPSAKHEGADAPGKRTAVTHYEKTDEASFLNVQVHDMAEQLIRNESVDDGPDSAVAVATFVDLNNLYRTSPFGRYLAEQLMGELQRAGYRVLEVRKTDSMMIGERFGEYSMSRDIDEIARQCSANHVLVGTYIVRGRYVLVNARMVSNEGNAVVSSAMKIFRRDPLLDSMLWPASTPARGPAVKMPLKGLGQPTDARIISGS